MTSVVEKWGPRTIKSIKENDLGLEDARDFGTVSFNLLILGTTFKEHLYLLNTTIESLLGFSFASGNNLMTLKWVLQLPRHFPPALETFLSGSVVPPKVG